MAEIFKIPYFESFPGEEEVKATLSQYLQVYGFKKLKVGSTKESSLESRYSSSDRYKQLSENNILCRASRQVALKIEKVVKEELAALDICNNGVHDNESDTDLNSTETCLVYLTELHDNLFICPFSNCGMVGQKDNVAQHMEQHKFIQFVKEVKAVLPDFDLQSDPVPYIHQTYKSNK